MSETRRTTADRGAAAIEMAFVLLILSFFLFGIISFGYMFTFRQNMTQAAAEGARAGAVAASSSTTTDATTAVNDAISRSFGYSCGSHGLTCTIPAAAPCTNDSSHSCITVTLSYDYRHYPLIPDAPLIAQFMPSTITVSSTARVS